MSESIFDDPRECDLCGHTGPKTNRFGQEMFREYANKTLCINHYSQAKWPDTYAEIADCVEGLVDDG